MSLDSINNLLAAVLPANRFYAEKLGDLGPVGSLEEFRAKAPFTTKDELAADHEAHPPYGRTLTYPLERYTRFHQTSGTRGQPLVWLDDQEGWNWVLETWRWVWREAGAKPGDSAFFPFSFGPFIGFWAAFEAATAMGMRALPGGGLSSENRLRLVAEHGPEFLACTPTYALHLAEVGKRMGLEVSGLGVECLVVCGEPGGSIPEVRDRIAGEWRARVVDHHGMTEVGPVTVSDREDPDLLRIYHASYFAEVVEPENGEAVGPGEVGELVLTTLGRYGSPLIRYRTGDLVKPMAVPGENPLHFGLEGGIIGRADDMVVVRGINVYPSAIEAVVRSCDGIGEYQVEVDERGALPEIRLVIENTTGESAEHELAASLRSVFSMRMPVTAVEPGTLPVFEVKAKRWKVIRK
ncbi:MAG: phenylacetate--CoA ligase [Akkermansiaceae bacterium]|nr:phenylacetate--CoA ligase [Akkermansiaceae bacterium]